MSSPPSDGRTGIDHRGGPVEPAAQSSELHRLERRRSRGWCGEEPPFDGDPATVLAQARDSAGGRDVRLSGGATTIREFLDADLVDTLHVAVSPVQLGSGVRLWEFPEELRDRCHCDVVPSRSGLTRHLCWRRSAQGAPLDDDAAAHR